MMREEEDSCQMNRSFDVEENEDDNVHDAYNVDVSGNSHAVQLFLVMVA